jgi:hypothetical protein
VFDRVLQEIKDTLNQQRYVMTLYVEEEMTDDNLSILDVEQSILTGKTLGRQTDRNTGEFKYRIRGLTLEGDAVDVIVKLGLTGKVVIITVYLL